MAKKRIIIVAGPNGAGLSGRGYIARIGRWRGDGYRVTLFVLSLRNPEDAIERVAARVSQGGHHVPEVVIRRRFAAGWRNFRKIYRHEADDWFLYDNSSSTPVLIERGGTG